MNQRTSYEHVFCSFPFFQGRVTIFCIPLAVNWIIYWWCINFISETETLNDWHNFFIQLNSYSKEKYMKNFYLNSALCMILLFKRRGHFMKQFMFEITLKERFHLKRCGNSLNLSTDDVTWDEVRRRCVNRTWRTTEVGMHRSCRYASHVTFNVHTY